MIAMKKKNTKYIIGVVILLALILGFTQLTVFNIEKPELVHTFIKDKTYNIGSHTLIMKSANIVDACRCYSSTSAYCNGVACCVWQTQTELYPDNHNGELAYTFILDGVEKKYTTGAYQDKCNIALSKISITKAGTYKDALKLQGAYLFEGYRVIDVRHDFFPTDAVDQYRGIPTKELTQQAQFTYEYPKLEQMIDIDEQGIVYTKQNYTIPVKINSFDSGNGYVDVQYKLDNSFFAPVIKTYNYTFVKGINNIKVPLPTETEANLEITMQGGIYLTLSNSNFIYSGILTLPTTYKVPMTAEKAFLMNVRPFEEKELIELQGTVLSLQERIDILKLTAEQQADEIKQVSDIIEVQAKAIAELNQSADKNILLINELYSRIDEQAVALNELNLSATENAEYITRLTSNINEQAILISEQQNTITENADIINNMNLQITESIRLIEELSKSQSDKDQYISQLLTNIASQDSKIQELSGIIDINAQQIIEMDATIEQQLNVIDNLNINIQEKDLLIVQLTNNAKAQSDKIKLLQELADNLGNDYAAAKTTIITLQSQLNTADDRVTFMLQTIDQLSLGNEDLKDLINSYESTILEDKLLISQLKLSNEELLTLVSGYKNNLAKEQELVKSLQLENAQLKTIILNYQDRLVYEQTLTAGLTLSNTQLKELAAQYKLNLEDIKVRNDALIISNDELNSIIADYQANLITEQEAVDKLKVSNTELQGLIKEYNDRLSSMGQYVAELELSNSDLQALLKSISSDNEYMKQLLAEIEASKTSNNSKLYIYIGVGLLLIAGLYMYFKRKRR
jgi:LPXTG-motif cell wall-anchored protein